MPASERDWSRPADDEPPRRPPLARGRLALWIAVSVVLAVGSPLTDILAWGWALLLLLALFLAAQITSWHWLHPSAPRPWWLGGDEDDDA